jgi:hypothetical protein
MTPSTLPPRTKNPQILRASWLDGIKPKDIAQSILAISKKKYFTVQKDLNEDFLDKELKL